MNVEVTSGLPGIKAVLRSASDQAPREGKRVLGRGALNVKKDAQGSIRGLAHAPAYPASITYDVRWHGMSGTAEIGPDKDKRQGSLGNILEYGTRNNAPTPHLGPALDRESPRFEKVVADLGEELLS